MILSTWEGNSDIKYKHVVSSIQDFILFLFILICVCSLIGSVIIVSGFYGVMWGKAKEKKVQEVDDDNGVEESLDSGKLPLLISKAEGRHLQT